MSTSDKVSQGVIPPEELRHRLIRAREHAGMNQRDIAAALDISVRTVNRYEAGEKPKRGILLGWAFVTGIDATWLVTGIDDGGHTIRYLYADAA